MRQGLCITLEPDVRYSCVFVDVDRDELEHLLVLMKLCACQAALPSLTDGRMEIPFLHKDGVFYLQSLSPLHSLGITLGSHPRSTPTESGLSLFSVTFLWRLLGSMNLTVSFDRWGHEGFKREGNLSWATVLVVDRIRMRSHIPNTPFPQLTTES